MRVNDALIGAVLLLLSLAVLWHVRDFPPIPGQRYGAALFPAVIAAGLAITSALLVRKGLKSGEPLFATETISRQGVVASITTIAVLVFYILFAEFLGFVLCAVLLLVALMWSYGVSWKVNLPVAVVSTLVIHAGFYRVLKVPLPWGLLQPVAW
ncbi:MAG: tripartite tricarboxylate transporter TctB family protein [Burkholderiaceae bacterium]